MKFLINKKVAVGLIIICGIIIVNVCIAFTNLLNFSFISSVVIIGVILLVFFILNQEAIIKKNKEKEQLERTDATAKEQLKFTDAAAKTQLDLTDAAAKTQLDLTDATAKTQLDLTDATAKEQLELTDATAKEQLKFTDAAAKTQLDLTDATAKTQLDLTDATAKEQLELTDATAKEQLKFTDATAKTQLDLTDATAKTQLDLTDATAKEQLERTDATAKEQLKFTDATAKTQLDLTDATAKTQLDLTDATAKEQLERTDATAKEQLERTDATALSEKLKGVAKDEFSAMITHELNTPLVPIIGYCKMFKTSMLGSIDQEQLEAIEVIEKNAKRLETLITDIMDVRKLDLDQMKFKIYVLSLDEFFSNLDSDYKKILENKRCQFTTNQYAKNLVIKTDKSRLRQVFDNLISNAIKFVPENKGKIETGCMKENSNIVFYIKDNGIGILQEKQKELFQKFYQIDTSERRSVGGTGLGLAISKGIVEKLGGTISVESDGKTGTTFYMKFPL